MILSRKYFQQIGYPYSDNSSKIFNWLAILFVILELVKVVGFVSVDIPHILIIGLIIIPVLWKSQKEGFRYLKIYLIYFLYLGLNVVVCNPPAVFQSGERLVLLILLLLCVSPVLQNNDMRNFRFKCLNCLLISVVVLSVISFFCYFLGINYNTNRVYVLAHDITDAGTFSGLFWTSMILGPLSAVATCYTVWLSLMTKQKTWMMVALATAGSTLFSASRSAVYGCVIGCIVIFLYFSKLWSQGIKRLLVVVIVACVVYPLWEGALSGINQKNEKNDVMGIYGSRTEKFEARTEEIKSSPILGIGFASVDIRWDVYDPITGTVEPGSSWLCILSMTGIIGFLFVLDFFIKAFKSAIHAKSKYGSLLSGLIVFFAFHFLFEGYVLAGGSVLCFMAWLVLGVGTDLENEKS